MKTKNGFVSNSSTSSFIVLGAKVNQPDDFADDQEESNWYDSTVYIEHGGVSHIRGEILADAQECLPEGEYTLDELNDIANKIADEYDINVNDVKLYFGTRPS